MGGQFSQEHKRATYRNIAFWGREQWRGLEKCRDKRQQRAFSLRLSEIFMVLATLVAPFLMIRIKAITLYDVLLLASFICLFAERRRIRFLEWKALIPVLVLAIFSTLATFRAIEPMESFFTLAQLLFVFLVQIPTMVTVLQNEQQQLLNYKISICAMGIVVCGCVSFFIAHPGFLPKGRLRLIYEDPGHLGWIFAIFMPFLFLWRSSTKRALRRFLKDSLLLTAFLLMLFSQTRAAWLAFSITVPFYIVLVRASRLNIRVIAKGLLKYGSIWAMVLTAAYFLFAPASVQRRIESSLNFQSWEIQSRVITYKATIPYIPEYFLIGAGLDNFAEVLERSGAVEGERTPSLKPHNFLLLNLVQIGFAGVLSLVYLVILFYRRMFMALKATSKDDARYKLMAAALTSFTAVLIISMFTTQITRRAFWFPYGFGLAVAYSVLSSINSKESQKKDDL